MVDNIKAEEGIMIALPDNAELPSKKYMEMLKALDEDVQIIKVQH